ncbi:hypothetical protein CFIMG_002393RA [Ceratocystis fimbriata CBS 114723]|uniref:Uncharacterized protein n=1 Tax=Ceratocystis fimbriata CBS 114723 TaxID=1035309 RepID=A0A2C5WZA5_9PEZI|nr:hypothetical protein CFIMG_002393RA [Ceratocystis fimbriata CBS 114723]
MTCDVLTPTTPIDSIITHSNDAQNTSRIPAPPSAQLPPPKAIRRKPVGSRSTVLNPSRTMSLSLRRNLTRDPSIVYPGPLDHDSRVELQMSSPNLSVANIGRQNCTHPEMVRYWSAADLCSHCMRPGAFGWLYRCCSDRNIMIEANMDNAKHDRHIFDKTGRSMEHMIKPRSKTVLTRTRKFDVLGEISNQEYSRYSPSQLASLVGQRSEVTISFILKATHIYLHSPIEKFVLTRMKYMQVLEAASKDFQRPHISKGLLDPTPHIPNFATECKYKCCPNCRPSFKDHAFLPLNAIMNDEVPATAVTGFGFHLLGARPVANAKILRSIGTRTSSRGEFEEEEVDPDAELVLKEPEPPFLPNPDPISDSVDFDSLDLHLQPDTEALVVGLLRQPKEEPKVDYPGSNRVDSVGMGLAFISRTISTTEDELPDRHEESGSSIYNETLPYPMTDEEVDGDDVNRNVSATDGTFTTYDFNASHFEYFAPETESCCIMPSPLHLPTKQEREKTLTIADDWNKTIDNFEVDASLDLRLKLPTDIENYLSWESESESDFDVMTNVSSSASLNANHASVTV